MILAFALTVVLDDGTKHEVTTNLRDQVAFERNFGVSVMELVPKSLITRSVQAAAAGPIDETALLASLTADDVAVKTERFAWLAWHALTRTKLVAVDFDSFCDLVVDIQFDVGRPVPTLPAPPTAS